MIDVTVIVPTHNRWWLLPQTVFSVLGQRGVSLELVVVNDGSSDGTGLWLDRLAATEPRLKIVTHTQPRFVSEARNAGVAVASGRWVAFCDDDDLWAPDKLATQLAGLRAGGARWGCTGVAVVNEALEVIGHHRVEGGNVLAGLLARNTIPTGSSVIAELALVREAGGFNPMLRGSEDWDLWIRLAQHSPLVAVDRPLIAYRQGGQSLSMNIGAMREGRLSIAERYAALAKVHAVKTDEAGHERYLARQLLRGGRRLPAASTFTTLAFRHRRWRELPRIAGALVAPRLLDRIGQARAAAAVPPSWRQETELWLRPIRDAAKQCVAQARPWAGTREQEA